MKATNILLALMSFLTVTLCSSTSRACKEGSIQCGGGSPGGAVFACKKGRWEVLMKCGPAESCTSDPIPTCTWASANAGSADNATQAITGFENAATEPTTATNKDSDATEGVTADDTAPYFNICSPCIRFNDFCKAKCLWQGPDCDHTCNWKTCAVNLTTGDFRQPTVSCGRFCKWPCY